MAAVVLGDTVVELPTVDVEGVEDEAVAPEVGRDEPIVTFAGLDWNESTPTRPTPVPAIT